MKLSNTLLLTLLVLCGCDSGSSRLAGIDGSGSQVSTVVTGPVNGFGSVIVNGIAFDTQGADIWIQGTPGSEEALRVGDMVTIAGHVENGLPVAINVYRRDGLTGPVEWLDAETREIGVLGQRVRVMEQTVFGESVFPQALVSLNLGDRVSISGMSGPGESFVATRIDLVHDALTVMSGPIGSYDAMSGMLRVRGVQVFLENPPAADVLRSGAWVSVSGRLSDNGVLHADKLLLDPALHDLPPNQATEVQGYIKASPQGGLRLDGLELFTEDDSLLQLALEAEATVASEVRVRGVIENGRLRVTDFDTQIPGDTRLLGRVERVLTEPLALEVDGLHIAVQADTRLAGPGGRRLQLQSLAAGDLVVITAYQQAEHWVATSIQIGAGAWQEGRQELKGLPGDMRPEAGLFSLGNREVRIAAETELLRGGERLDSRSFFDALPERRVIVEGTLDGDVLLATRVRLLPRPPAAMRP